MKRKLCKGYSHLLVISFNVIEADHVKYAFPHFPNTLECAHQIHEWVDAISQYTESKGWYKTIYPLSGCEGAILCITIVNSKARGPETIKDNFSQINLYFLLSQYENKYATIFCE